MNTMTGKRYLNKKLQAAIDQGKPLRWEFGRYNHWYEGLKLIANTGYAETGHVYESAVFCTTSIRGAVGICIILDAEGIKYTGWDMAVSEYKKEQRREKP